MTEPGDVSARSRALIPDAAPTVLFADDDEAMRWVVRDALESEGFRVILAADGREVVDLLAASAPAVVVTDLRMPDGGLEMVERLRATSPTTPIILITSFGDPRLQTSALAFGIAAYFNKPVRMAELTQAIRRMLRVSGPVVPV